MINTVNQGESSATLAATLDQSQQNLIARDSDLFFHQQLSTPVANTISKVEGAYIYDGEGRKYLDLHGNGVHTVGYNNPFVLKAIANSIETGLTFAPRRFTNEPAVQLAEKLKQITPVGLDKVLFCPGGSEAIEMAIMLAKRHTNTWKTLSFEGAFHGSGFQAVTIGADPHFHEGLGPLMPGAIHLEMPDFYRNPWGFDDEEKVYDHYFALFKTLVENNEDIAAFISEPIFYTSSVPTKNYWEQVQTLCKQHGILMIFDEIYTAFGRTGKMFACEHFVTPDILVYGKGFGGGVVPFAGIIGRDDLNTMPDRSIGHFTHEKSPFCASVSQAVIDYIIAHDLVEKTEELGMYFKSGLEELQQEFDFIGNIQGLGLNLAVDLVEDRNTKARAYAQAQSLVQYAFQEGVSLKLIQGNILSLKPALVIEKNEIDDVLKVLKHGFEIISKK